MAEALETIFVLGWALLAWVAVLSALFTTIVLAVIAAVWWTGAVVWRQIRRRRPARADYEEAA
ncbi:hypothetical protein AB0C80_18300 [Streptomyces anthocyanicus]|uniref:hypothetical protein n=1 Tax=Streptomyces anthocyanicus TaxID=68174 RepID=UPI0033DACB2C